MTKSQKFCPVLSACVDVWGNDSGMTDLWSTKGDWREEAWVRTRLKT